MKLYRYIPALDRTKSCKLDEPKLYGGMLENLRNARLQLAHPASFNDPLEAIIPYKFIEQGKIVSPNLDDLKEILAEHLDFADWTTARAKRILEGLPFGITIENALMLSLSKAMDSHLMWAHYADNHRGICLEFNFPCDFLDKVTWSEQTQHHIKNFNLSPAFGKVNYEIERIPIVFRDGIAGSDYNMENALLSKPKCWEYEQEYRVLLLYPQDSKCAFGVGMDTKEWYFEYPKEWLTGITFGMRLPNAYRKELAEYVRKAGYQNITWKEETLANNRFEIASEQIEI